MARRTWAVPIVVALVAAACGGSDTEPYFTEVGQIMAGYDRGSIAGADAFDAAVAAIDAESASAEEDFVAATQDFFDAVAPQLAAAVSAMQAVEAPAEVAEENEEFVAALVDLEGSFAALGAELSNANTVDEVVVLFHAFDASEGRFTVACAALEAEATARDLTVDLACR